MIFFFTFNDKIIFNNFINLILNFKHMKFVLLLLLVLIKSEVSYPNLLKKQFSMIQWPIINVTVGEKFMIPLPNFDSLWDHSNFKAYEISNQDFKEVSPSNQQQIKAKDSKFNSQIKQIGIDYLPFRCSLVDPLIQIGNQIKTLRDSYSRIHNNIKWQQNQYVHLSFKSLIYILNVASSEIKAYFYNEVTLDFLTSYKLNALMDHQENTEATTSTPVMAASTKENYIYIFTNIGIWELETKTILTSVKKIQNISGFNSANFNGIDKVLHGDNYIFFGLKRLEKIFFIPEKHSQSQKNQKFLQISHFNGTKMFPQDIAFRANNLYILDFYKGVYIFKLVGSGQIKQKAFLPFQTFGGNYQFRVYQNSIFINFNDFDGSKIIEMSNDWQKGESQIVRFYKSNDFISSLDIFNVLTTIPSNGGYWKQESESAFESYLFLIQNYGDIQIYPFNIDPRIITKSYNGLKLKGNDVRKIFHLNTDHYIIVTNQALKYVQISIKKPYLLCKTQRSQKQISDSKYFKISIKNNITSCQHKDSSSSAKNFYNQYCQITQSYFLHINDPEQSQMQKLLLYGLVISVVVCFIIGLLCLIQWRNSKMLVLGRLKDQIIKFRNKHKKMQPFTEEVTDQIEVQIEVPQIHVSMDQA